MLPKDCPCGSGHPYIDCCDPIHRGAVAAHPEALMRSRYAAHALNNLDYILASWAVEGRASVDVGQLRTWLDSARFGQLRVLRATGNEVEFECWYLQDDQLHHLHDLSLFTQEDGHWRYAASRAPTTRATPIGRNDRCPCGSGKKYKQCCSGRLAG